MMRSVSLARRPWFLLLFFGLVAIATRYPLIPGQLFSFDDVNLAYSIDHFDIRVSQPQPPGYPLFVMEMRALWALRFRRPESILVALSLAGSIAALFLMAIAGNRMFGGSSGFYAACVMALQPAFWYAGLTSALRVQLALISVAVGAACWRAWRGDGRWVVPGAIVLGLAAGIRPETGPLLLPLWAASAWRAPVSWRRRAAGLAAMSAAVLVWLVPAMAASGGPLTFIDATLGYITDQASVNSGLFGARQSEWVVTFWRAVVWSFCGVPACVLAAVLAWRRGAGWEFGRERAAFFALWLTPSLAFFLLVHVQDPGQTLAVVAAVSLACGYLVNRALENSEMEVSRWHSLTLGAGAVALCWLAFRRIPEMVVAYTPLVCLAAGLVLRRARIKNAGFVPRFQMAAILVAPVLLVNTTIFEHKGWYYRGSATEGLRAVVERTGADIADGFATTSYAQIHATMKVDDASIREMLRLAGERPGATVVVWEHGLTSWRKAAYYAPRLPVVVLEHKQIRAGSPPVAALWNGPRLIRRTEGEVPVRVPLPPGARIIWMLNPNTDFYGLVHREFNPSAAGTVWYTDLPPGSGTRRLGEYELAW